MENKVKATEKKPSTFKAKLLKYVHAATTAVGVLGAVAVSAEETITPATFEVTADLVAPIQTAINSGLTTLVPIGIGIMAVMIGIGLIPRIIYRFL